jgi:hypothetical protein
MSLNLYWIEYSCFEIEFCFLFGKIIILILVEFKYYLKMWMIWNNFLDRIICKREKLHFENIKFLNLKIEI